MTFSIHENLNMEAEGNRKRADTSQTAISEEKVKHKSPTVLSSFVFFPLTFGPFFFLFQNQEVSVLE